MIQGDSKKSLTTLPLFKNIKKSVILETIDFAQNMILKSRQPLKCRINQPMRH